MLNDNLYVANKTNDRRVTSAKRGTYELRDNHPPSSKPT